MTYPTLEILSMRQILDARACEHKIERTMEHGYYLLSDTEILSSWAVNANTAGGLSLLPPSHPSYWFRINEMPPHPEKNVERVRRQFRRRLLPRHRLVRRCVYHSYRCCALVTAHVCALVISPDEIPGLSSSFTPFPSGMRMRVQVFNQVTPQATSITLSTAHLIAYRILSYCLVCNTCLFPSDLALPRPSFVPVGSAGHIIAP
ncbi:unnamed protein product [Cyclocybe aegerita]|uniref:Uncharacterized protein n=1 Tax=Cyclocybe aegerita TaxID=1973307 RepID=A0A8S0VR31_CYCAE|nr:unnamed protein product [Cyclocybe aegerita]